MFLQKQIGPETGIRINPRFLSYTIALVAFLLLLLAAAPSAQAQGRCMIHSYPFYFHMSGDYISGTRPLYTNSSCAPPSEGTISFGKYGVVDAGGRSSAIAKCISRTGFSNMEVGPFGAVLWSCKPIFDKDGSSGGTFGNSRFYQPPEIHVTALPLGTVRVNAELGLNSGIQFQRYDHYAVGVQSVVDRGILDVVDVWGQASQNFEVCFPQEGAIVFVDSATSPRQVSEVDSAYRDGYTCGVMDRAGQMVLVKGESSSQSSTELAQAFIDATTDDIGSAIALENCLVSSPHNLNMREEPWGVKITVLPKNTSVPATARTESWYRVRFVESEADDDNSDSSAAAVEGWISAWLSEGDGACDWQSDDEDSPALASSDVTPDEELSVAALLLDLRL